MGTISCPRATTLKRAIICRHVPWALSITLPPPLSSFFFPEQCKLMHSLVLLPNANPLPIVTAQRDNICGYHAHNG